MISTLRKGRWGARQKWDWDVIGCSGWGLASVLDVQSLFFLLKKIGFAPWSDIILSQTLIYYWQEIFLLTLTSDSKAILMPLHCLWAKSNSRTRDMAWFCFCFDFVRSDVRCGCYSIVSLRFQVVQIKQVDCKMSAKNVNNYK